MEAKVKELLLQIKMQIQNKPGRGIRYLKAIFKKIWRKWKRKTWSSEVKKWFHLCEKAYVFFCIFLFLFALRMSQKQRIKEGVFRWETVQAINNTWSMQNSRIPLHWKPLYFIYNLFYINFNGSILLFTYKYICIKNYSK